MYVDGVSFQTCLDHFGPVWLESIEVKLFCMKTLNVSADWSKPDREAVNQYCVWRSVDRTGVLTLQKPATGPTNRATKDYAWKVAFWFLCFQVFLLEHALTLQAGSNALNEDISLALSLLQPWDPEPGTKTNGTDVAWMRIESLDRWGCRLGRGLSIPSFHIYNICTLRYWPCSLRERQRLLGGLCHAAPCCPYKVSDHSWSKLRWRNRVRQGDGSPGIKAVQHLLSIISNLYVIFQDAFHIFWFWRIFTIYNTIFHNVYII